MACSFVLLEGFAYFKTVFFGHHHIGNNDIGDGTDSGINSLLSIRRPLYTVFFFKTNPDILCYVGIVFHHQGQRQSIIFFIR